MQHVRLFLLALCSGLALLGYGQAGAAQAPGLGTHHLPALVDRLTWGFTPQELERARRLGVQGYIDAQLAANPRARLPDAVQKHIDALRISKQTSTAAFTAIRQLEQEMRREPDASKKQAIRRKIQNINNVRAADTARRAVWRAVYTPHQLHDQMTWFWMNHFNVYASKGNTASALADYEEFAIRRYALGKFRDLLRATTRSPAMLIYLDNQYNRVGKINENYARELLELHTLGVDGGYTQKDVQELARILTGLGINYTRTAPKVPANLQAQIVQQGNFLFNPRHHDYTDKHLLGHLIPGAGLVETDRAIEILARHPATARHISRKLATYMVSDQPSDELVAAMADTFRATDGDIAATLRTLFSSGEFRDSLSNGKFKDPVHYVYSSLRLAYAELPPLANVNAAYRALTRMGQPLYRRVTPDGYPLTQSHWSGSGQMMARFAWAKSIVTNPTAFYITKDDGKDVPLPPMPRLADRYPGMRGADGLSAAAGRTLEQARSVSDANIYLLSSPDFMSR